MVIKFILKAKFIIDSCSFMSRKISPLVPIIWIKCRHKNPRTRINWQNEAFYYSKQGKYVNKYTKRHNNWLICNYPSIALAWREDPLSYNPPTKITPSSIVPFVIKITIFTDCHFCMHVNMFAYVVVKLCRNCIKCYKKLMDADKMLITNLSRKYWLSYLWT